jgi:type IX secretion system PorP/SprF family membrane protein
MKNCFLYGILFLSPSILAAQDPHFSQYFSSPLTFNPALTGYFDGTQRLSLQTRNQWSIAGDGYTTGTFSLDSRILKKQTASNDRWGVGLMGLYDQSAGGVYKNTYVSLSTAFNKGLDEEGNQRIGIGIQTTLATKRIDVNSVSFGNQFNGSGFDLSLPNGESVINRSLNYIDLNAGLLYNFKDDNDNRFSFGGSAFHLLQPRLSFFSNGNPVLPTRYTLHASAVIPVQNNNRVFISTHFMQQAQATEFVIGGAYAWNINSSDYHLYAGGWLRVNDAIYPYLGLQGNQWQLGLSYDITQTDIRQSVRKAGSLELSVQILFNSDQRKKGIPCFF